MNVMDLFKSKPAEPAQSTQQTAQNPADKNLSDPSPSTDANGKMPGTPGTQVNPLDVYSEMYKNANTNTELAAPSFKIDPKVLGEVSNSMDFTKGVQPELLDKALSGDTKALLAVIQSVGRNAYSASLEHTTALTETHLSQRADYESKRLNDGVKTQLTSNELSNAPNYSHPVVKAELNRVAGMFAKANPDASPQQIAKAAQEHLTQLSAALNPTKTPEQTKAEGEMDWSKYLS